MEIKQFKIPIEYIKLVAGGFNNSFIFLGNHGLGKTTTTINTLKELKTKYKYHSGVSTPKALYQFLYEHREDETLVFDDCMGLINNPNALSILLSALWSSDGERVVNWATTKDDLGLPTKFNFNSRVIIITNKMPETYYANVVMSRCLTYEIEFTHKELIDFMYKIGDKEIVDYIAKNSSPATRGFDLRVLKKAENIVKYCKKNKEVDWKELVSPMLDNINEEMEMVLQGCSEYNFMEKTGKSRRTYFRYKKKCQSAVPNNIYKEKAKKRTFGHEIQPLNKEKETFSKNGVEYGDDGEETSTTYY